MMEPFRPGSIVIFCITMTTLGVSALQCPSCTYVTTTGDVNSLVKTIIETVTGVFQDKECAGALTAPNSKIKEETCVQQSGKVAKCSFYKGDINLEVSLFGTIDVSLKMYQRGCYYALPANVPSNGCHPRQNLNEDKTFLQQVLAQGSSLLKSTDVVDFKGDMCLCSDTYCQASGSTRATVWSGSTRATVWLSGLLILQVLSTLFIL